MMHFTKAHGNFYAPVDDVMAAYVRQCAITLNCRQLALAGRFLADTARHPGDPDADRTARRMRRLLALMTTCGHYDRSGDFACRVGLPAKSGVGGGIMAVAPGIASIDLVAQS